MRKLAGEFGPLERVIMDYVWDQPGAITVRQVFEAVGERRGLAYTTIMTVMDRLQKKRLLRRTKLGRAFVYEAVATREEHTAELVKRVLAGAQDRRAVLLGFVEAVEMDELAELQRLVREAKRRRSARPR